MSHHEDSPPLLRVGGVPEHFNYPWHIAIQRNIFAKQSFSSSLSSLSSPSLSSSSSSVSLSASSLSVENNLNVEWRDYKGGTGDLLNALKNGEVDVIVALTEGLVKEIAGNPKSEVRLLGTYVESPLCWAISTAGPNHVPLSNSTIHSISDLQHQKIGVSRLTSGSHLMTCVLATQRGWAQDDVSYVLCGNFDGLRDSVNKQETAAFMWETFMTKPFHDNGDLRRIGEITTPWPCFMIASTLSVLQSKRHLIHQMMEGIQESCRLFAEEKDSIPLEIAEKYSLKPEDAKTWYDNVTITATSAIPLSAIETVVSALKEAKVLPGEYTLVPTDLIDVEFAHYISDIKSMRIYNKPELITALHGRLRQAGLMKGPVAYTDLLAFDQNHYRGVEAVEKCVTECQLGPNSNVIDIGSGFGGPARYIAGRVGSHVIAVELQRDLNSVASELTERCGNPIRNRVFHIAGDFLSVSNHLSPSTFDCITSWLTILHFDHAQRMKLFEICWSLLKPGGKMYIEDFMQERSKGLTLDEEYTLRHDVYCLYLPSLHKYIEELASFNFSITKVENLTADWVEFTRDRLRQHQLEREENIKILGSDTYSRLSYFYGKVAALFAGGKVGGVRIVVTKPLR